MGVSLSVKFWISGLMKIELDFSRPGKPKDTPFIEIFNGSFADECLNVNWFFSLDDAQEKFDHWKEDYNGFRPNSSLGDPPMSSLK
ncbi:integrase catalytic subunit [Zunongwangia atlantica 22II14-10F7]|uniref:Integrase catalytic subunit n=1 Tax=Zunongwangia atlantica 22II14-10F7 TaxID=1185767 RepID=A0A1Y1T2S3_9FLAO|nr:integrase catalytic subunit [Zunongwangia atlantica 22II14-10F7]